MYSIRRRMLFLFSIMSIFILFVVLSISYYSFRSFIMELLQSFPKEFSVFLHQNNIDNVIKINSESVIFSLFMKKFQPLFFLLIGFSVGIMLFSLSLVNIMTKKGLTEGTKAVLNQNTKIPREFMGIQKQMDLYITEINHFQDQNKTFQSYASHELRNELAKLRGFYYKYQIEEDEILEQQQNVEQTIEDLLILSALQNKVEKDIVNVLEEVAKVIDDIKQQNLRMKITLAYDEMGDFEVLGKRSWFYRACYNLLDNAIKYSVNSKISVVIKIWHEYLILEVINQIADKNVVMFPEKAKNNGIGLKLVEQVAQQSEGYFYYEINKGIVKTILTLKK